MILINFILVFAILFVLYIVGVFFYCFKTESTFNKTAPKHALIFLGLALTYIITYIIS